MTRLALILSLCAMLAFPGIALADDGGRHHGSGHHRDGRHAEQDDAYAYVCVPATIGGEAGIRLTLTLAGTTAIVYVQGATCPEDASEDFDTLAALDAALSQPNFGPLATWRKTVIDGILAGSGSVIITAGGGVIPAPPGGTGGTNI